MYSTCPILLNLLDLTTIYNGSVQIMILICNFVHIPVPSFLSPLLFLSILKP
jgi:hypothetical protein